MIELILMKKNYLIKKYKIGRNTLFGLLIGSVSMLLILLGNTIYQLYQYKVMTIAPTLIEVSGLEYDKSGKLWAINDGGDESNLYQLDTQGRIKKTITIWNAKNIDWEDMTQDYFGHFFIGDFGNNDNDRKWLTIYKIENPIDIKGTTAKAEIIKFQYLDQLAFPPKAEDKNFDLEAFIYYKRHLYLFTKNRKEPFDGETTLYKIGDHAANYDATKISQFTTCKHMQKLCWITSAALSPDRKKLVLLDSQHIWLFENWSGDDFFSGDVYQIKLGIVTQKEAITFEDNNTLIFADEEFIGVGRNVYRIKLDQIEKTRVQSVKP
jgi:hypothetical protein